MQPGDRTRVGVGQVLLFLESLGLTAGGTPLRDTDHSLKAGRRGPVLLADQHLREKINHFDHERIPERVVHAATREQEGEHYEDGGRYMTLATFYDEYARAPSRAASVRTLSTVSWRFLGWASTPSSGMPPTVCHTA